MNYDLTVWLEDEPDTPPVMETTITIDEHLEKEVINIIESSLRMAFEVMFNKPVIVEFARDRIEFSYV